MSFDHEKQQDSCTQCGGTTLNINDICINFYLVLVFFTIWCSSHMTFDSHQIPAGYLYSICITYVLISDLSVLPFLRVQGFHNLILADPKGTPAKALGSCGDTFIPNVIHSWDTWFTKFLSQTYIHTHAYVIKRFYPRCAHVEPK